MTNVTFSGKNKHIPAFRGIPNIIEIDMNSGYVKAIPKLTKKLNTAHMKHMIKDKKPTIKESNSKPQYVPSDNEADAVKSGHGISAALKFSTPVKYRMIKIVHSKVALLKPRSDRNKETFPSEALPTIFLKITYGKILK